MPFSTVQGFTDRPVVVLKSPRYGDPTDHGPLPYRIDELEHDGFRLAWTDRHMSGIWLQIARSERWFVPWVQAWLTRRERRSAVVTLAMFESEGHGLALARRLTRRHEPPLVIIGCWLADLARAGGPRRHLYRWLYRSVDTVIVFSSNQRDTLVGLLDIDPARIAVVHFGVDLDELAQIPTSDGGTVVAAGRDLGRDWPTLLGAAAGTGWTVDLMTREQQLRGLALPPEVRSLGAVGRSKYLNSLANASVVVVPTHVREYPTGQSVLLEAMALGKACVVTDTPAMREYVDNGVTGILVSPGDPTALRDVISDLLRDEALRTQLGRDAHEHAISRGGASTMWMEIGSVLSTVVSGSSKR